MLNLKNIFNFKKMKNEKNNSSRPIDKAMSDTTKNLASHYAVMSKTEIKAWKAYLTVFFMSGFCAALILSAYNSWYIGSRALTGPTIFTQTTNEVHKAGEAFQTQLLLDSASQSVNAVQVIATFDPALVSISSVDTASSDFPNEVLKKIDTTNNKITIASAKQTPGMNSSQAKIATVNISAIKDFNGAGITLKFLTSSAIDDSAAIADDGKGTNVLSAITAKFTNPVPPPPPVDTAAPLRSGGSPTGTISAGTTQVTLKVTTNENATCKYGTSAGTAYDAMANTFSAAGTTSHTATITGITDGKTYTYYVKCKDAAGNVNADDYSITFSTGSNITPPPTDTTPPTLSNGLPNGTLAAGTTSATLKVDTDEAATCRYSSSSGTTYGNMGGTFSTTGATSHSTSVTGLADGKTYNYYVRCKDTAGNSDTSDYKVSFSIATPPPPADTTPPALSGGSPTGTLSAGTTSANLKVTTNETATCKFSTTAGTAYSSMSNSISTTDNLNHYSGISGLADGKSYNYYIRCTDSAGNTNTSDYKVSFSIATPPPPADTTPPALSGGSPTGTLSAGTTSATLKVTTDEAATCRYSSTSGTTYGNMGGTFSTTGATSHSTSVTGLADGKSYNYYVRCKDTAGNTNSSDYAISFSTGSNVTPPPPSADSTPPVVTNGSPSGSLPAGTKSAALKVTTNESATCKYSTRANTAYSSMPYTFSSTGGSLHQTTVSGLRNNRTYNYYVKCSDSSGNADKTDYRISFRVRFKFLWWQF